MTPRTHKLLQRQLRKAFGSVDDAPAALAPLLALVDEAYRQADIDRAQLGWSLETMSAELVERNVELLRQLDEQRAMQRALERSRALLAEAHEIARLGSWDYDVLAERANWSPEVYRLYGAEPSEAPLTWESITAIVPAPEVALLRATFARTVATRAPFAFDHRFVLPCGEKRVVHLRGRAVTDASGAVVRLVGTAQDITEPKQLEERIAQSQRLEAVGQLAAGIAHEINTPVQYVGDNLRFIQDALVELLPAIDAGVESLAYYRDELPLSVSQALDGTARIAEIVRAVKAVAHPGDESKTVIDLNTIVETAIAVSRSEWRYVAEVQTDLDRTLPPLVCLAGEMHQVILNLLVNAAQAIAEAQRGAPGLGSQRTGCIRVRTRLVGDAIEIAIGDNGMGISEAIQARVFDPFFTTKPVGKGTGQGLALAHRVVTSHAGQITFTSVPGHGTEFTIRLPLAGDATDEPSALPSGTPAGAPR
jgi:PAS domain S-box-containing protein